MKPTHTAHSPIQFTICIAAAEHADIQVWKIYRVLPDPKAQEVGCLRVIDESGEDYLYPQTNFVIMELPTDIREQLLATVEK